MAAVSDRRGGPAVLRAEIIAVGSEMLTPTRVDTNSLFITEQLNEVGVELWAKAVVGDDRDDLRAVFARALERSDLVVVTGGLGPTQDDITRDVVAEVLGLPLEEDEEAAERIRQRFAARGLRMPEINRRQALVPRGAVALANQKGTAPGLWIEHDGRRIALLPGPPREMKPLFERVAREYLAPVARGARLYRRVLKITGRTESHVEEIAHPVYSRWLEGPNRISTTILAVPGQIELHLTTRASDAAGAGAVLARATGELAAALGADLFSTDGGTMEQVVGDLLRERHLWIALAESCTGGLATSRLTDVPGSSEYVERSVVCYSNRAKTDLLGVPASLIVEHGAVSEPVGLAMATGIRERADVDIGVGITGIAGPTGGSDRKPVGTVVIAMAWRGGSRVRTMWFPGGREQVKFFASQAALDMVRRWLIGPDA
jgi:nicotinamide-nucleotide amidase